MIERVPPNDLAAETAVLGACLLNKEVMVHLPDGLTPESFYRTGHQKIFAAMLALEADNIPVDTVTLGELLRARGDLEKVGGVAFLSELTSEVPSVAHALHYANIVEKLASLRSQIRAGTEAVQAAYTVGADPEDIAAKLITASETGPGNVDAVGSKELLSENTARMERIYEGTEPEGIKTGFIDLDDVCPIFPSDLVLVAGRPGMGKTTFGFDIKRGMCRAGVKVATYSLEMSRSQCIELMVSQEGGPTRHQIRRRKIGKGDFPQIASATGKLFGYDFWIDDRAALTPLQIRRSATKLKRQHGIGAVIIDYLQLMRGGARFGTREQEIAFMSQSMKAMAKDLELPVILLAQLNREVEGRPDKEPRPSDLRESGSLEQDADIILFPWRPSVYWPLPDTEKEREKMMEDDPDEYQRRLDMEGMARVIVGKQRAGPPTRVSLGFNPERTTFTNWTDRY
jgi:replicative DNA helicase